MKRFRHGQRTITIATATIEIEGLDTVDGSYVQALDGDEVVQSVVSLDSVEKVVATFVGSWADLGVEYEVLE